MSPAPLYSPGSVTKSVGGGAVVRASAGSLGLPTDATLLSSNPREHRTWGLAAPVRVDTYPGWARDTQRVWGLAGAEGD